ncbi:mucin-2-like [Ornithodoros turicata]|uniref:mucin-2-like n=1 Tax=Ornithodoros turicata TaxID=34597 RepID=UPI0031392D61
MDHTVAEDVNTAPTEVAVDDASVGDVAEVSVANDAAVQHEPSETSNKGETHNQESEYNEQSSGSTEHVPNTTQGIPSTPSDQEVAVSTITPLLTGTPLVLPKSTSYPASALDATTNSVPEEDNEVSDVENPPELGTTVQASTWDTPGTGIVTTTTAVNVNPVTSEGTDGTAGGKFGFQGSSGSSEDVATQGIQKDQAGDPHGEFQHQQPGAPTELTTWAQTVMIPTGSNVLGEVLTERPERDGETTTHRSNVDVTQESEVTLKGVMPHNDVQDEERLPSYTKPQTHSTEPSTTESSVPPTETIMATSSTTEGPVVLPASGNKTSTDTNIVTETPEPYEALEEVTYQNNNEHTTPGTTKPEYQSIKPLKPQSTAPPNIILPTSGTIHSTQEATPQSQDGTTASTVTESQELLLDDVTSRYADYGETSSPTFHDSQPPESSTLPSTISPQATVTTVSSVNETPVVHPEDSMVADAEVLTRPQESLSVLEDVTSQDNDDATSPTTNTGLQRSPNPPSTVPLTPIAATATTEPEAWPSRPPTVSSTVPSAPTAEATTVANILDSPAVWPVPEQGLTANAHMAAESPEHPIALEDVASGGNVQHLPTSTAEPEAKSHQPPTVSSTEPSGVTDEVTKADGIPDGLEVRPVPEDEFTANAHVVVESSEPPDTLEDIGSEDNEKHLSTSTTEPEAKSHQLPTVPSTGPSALTGDMTTVDDVLDGPVVRPVPENEFTANGHVVAESPEPLDALKDVGSRGNVQHLPTSTTEPEVKSHQPPTVSSTGPSAVTAEATTVDNDVDSPVVRPVAEDEFTANGHVVAESPDHLGALEDVASRGNVQHLPTSTTEPEAKSHQPPTVPSTGPSALTTKATTVDDALDGPAVRPVPENEFTANAHVVAESPEPLDALEDVGSKGSVQHLPTSTTEPEDKSHQPPIVPSPVPPALTTKTATVDDALDGPAVRPVPEDEFTANAHVVAESPEPPDALADFVSEGNVQQQPTSTTEPEAKSHQPPAVPSTGPSAFIAEATTVDDVLDGPVVRPVPEDEFTANAHVVAESPEPPDALADFVSEGNVQQQPTSTTEPEAKSHQPPAVPSTETSAFIVEATTVDDVLDGPVVRPVPEDEFTANAHVVAESPEPPDALADFVSEGNVQQQPTSTTEPEAKSHQPPTVHSTVPSAFIAEATTVDDVLDGPVVRPVPEDELTANAHVVAESPEPPDALEDVASEDNVQQLPTSTMEPEAESHQPPTVPSTEPSALIAEATTADDVLDGPVVRPILEDELTANAHVVAESPEPPDALEDVASEDNVQQLPTSTMEPEAESHQPPTVPSTEPSALIAEATTVDDVLDGPVVRPVPEDELTANAHVVAESPEPPDALEDVASEDNVQQLPTSTTEPDAKSHQPPTVPSTGPSALIAEATTVDDVLDGPVVRPVPEDELTANAHVVADSPEPPDALEDVVSEDNVQQLPASTIEPEAKSHQTPTVPSTGPPALIAEATTVDDVLDGPVVRPVPEDELTANAHVVAESPEPPDALEDVASEDNVQQLPASTTEPEAKSHQTPTVPSTGPPALIVEASTVDDVLDGPVVRPVPEDELTANSHVVAESPEPPVAFEDVASEDNVQQLPASTAEPEAKSHQTPTVPSTGPPALIVEASTVDDVLDGPVVRPVPEDELTANAHVVAESPEPPDAFEDVASEDNVQQLSRSITEPEAKSHQPPRAPSTGPSALIAVTTTVDDVLDGPAVRPVPEDELTANAHVVAESPEPPDALEDVASEDNVQQLPTSTTEPEAKSHQPPTVPSTGPSALVAEATTVDDVLDGPVVRPILEDEFAANAHVVAQSPEPSDTSNVASGGNTERRPATSPQPDARPSGPPTVSGTVVLAATAEVTADAIRKSPVFRLVHEFAEKRHITVESQGLPYALEKITSKGNVQHRRTTDDNFMEGNEQNISTQHAELGTVTTSNDKLNGQTPESSTLASLKQQNFPIVYLVGSRERRQHERTRETPMAS